MVIGYIFSEKEVIDLNKNFILKTKDNFDINNIEKPTLIVGWNLVKELGIQANILNKHINDNLYWTFSPNEKRGIYEEDLDKFIRYSYSDFIKDIKIENIDPIIYNINDTNELIIRLEKFRGCFTYLYKDIIYIFNDMKIYVLDLRLIKFINFDYDLILNWFKENSSIVTDISEFSEELKFLNLKYIPYIKLKNGQSDVISLIC